MSGHSDVSVRSDIHPLIPGLENVADHGLYINTVAKTKRKDLLNCLPIVYES